MVTENIDPWVWELAVGGVAVGAVYLASTVLFTRMGPYLPGISGATLRKLFRLPIVVSTGLIVVWVTFGPEPPGFDDRLAPSLWTVAIAVWLPVLLRGGRYALTQATATDYIEQEVQPILQNLVTITLLLGAAGTLFSVWGIDITPVLASAGVLGIVLGFAARETIANFLASLSLYADDTYQPGDLIEIESADVSGYVNDISIRSTTLTTLDGNHTTIPNSVLNEAVITNLSTPRPVRRLRVPVGVSYDADPEHVRAVLTAVVDKKDIVLEQPEPQVHLRRFDESAVIFELLVWIDRPREALAIENDLNTTIYEALRDAGIEIPYPQREVKLETTEQPGDVERHH